MRIILIGPSGIGKTKIAQQISTQTNLNYYDMDALLHEKLNFPAKQDYSKEEILIKKETELNILKLILNEDNFILSTCAGIIEGQTSSNIIKLKEILQTQKNVILLLPYQDINQTKKFLMQRFNIIAVSKDMSLQFEKDINIFKKISKKIIYTKTNTPKEISKEILNIIE